jgi:hypothetical protein
MTLSLIDAIKDLITYPIAPDRSGFDSIPIEVRSLLASPCFPAFPKPTTADIVAKLKPKSDPLGILRDAGFELALDPREIGASRGHGPIA